MMGRVWSRVARIIRESEARTALALVKVVFAEPFLICMLLVVK
jgi:hypothetical protein